MAVALQPRSVDELALAAAPAPAAIRRQLCCWRTGHLRCHQHCPQPNRCLSSPKAIDVHGHGHGDGDLAVAATRNAAAADGDASDDS